MHPTADKQSPEAPLVNYDHRGAERGAREVATSRSLSRQCEAHNATIIMPEADSIDVNLPCLACGYFLRGLPGDLIRCPECFTVTARAELTAIAREQARMRQRTQPSPQEHSASICALAVAACTLVVALYVIWPYFWGPILPTVFGTAGVEFACGLFLYAITTRSADNWLTALVRYHVFAVPSILVNIILLSMIPGFIATYSQNGIVGMVVFIAMLIGILARNPMGWLNRHARRQLERVVPRTVVVAPKCSS